MDVVCVDSLQAVTADQWQALRGTEQPLMSHTWLRALETSRSVGEGTGWTPLHLLVRDGEDLVGALPLYAKAHSFGEFVYDWAWAEVAGRQRVPYYPKLVSTTPLTPAEGTRLLVARSLSDAAAATVREALLDAARELAQGIDASGVHLLFVDDVDREAALAAGYFVRTSWQYHWRNDAYRSFDDFLARLDSKRRRSIRRERRILAEQGYRVEAVHGRDLTTTDVADLFRYYVSTCRAYRTQPYLRRPFFETIVAEQPDSIVAFFAKDPGGRRIAGTFNVMGADRLWGRYWGADEHVPLLHFETCLYAMIDYAIAHSIDRIEPGAGGEHKYARGFEAAQTSSVHWLANPRLHKVLEQVTRQERDHVDRIVAELDERGPLRRAVETA